MFLVKIESRFNSVKSAGRNDLIDIETFNRLSGWADRNTSYL